MKVQLNTLPDINTWTSQRSIANMERTADQVNACVFSVLKDLRRTGDSLDEQHQFCTDILCLLDMMPLYFYDAEKKCLSTIPYPKGKLMSPFPVPIDVNYDKDDLDDGYAADLLGELQNDFNTLNLTRITGESMRLFDALYLIHRGNTETVLWYALLNRLRRQGVVTLDNTEDVSLKFMMSLVAQSIQSIVQMNFVIKNHKVPGRSNQYVLMELRQSVDTIEPSPLELTLFAAMNRPLTPDILIPCLDTTSVAYHFIPKDTLR